MKIGIDLGATNSALAYIDEREAEDRDFPPVHIFDFNSNAECRVDAVGYECEPDRASARD